jgi:hypothetical protein
MWIISGPFDAVRPTTDDPAALKLAYSHSSMHQNAGCARRTHELCVQRRSY